MLTRRTVLAAAVLAATLLAPARLHAAEICGNLTDDAPTNGLADEGCYPTATSGICESPQSCASNGAVAPVTGALVYPMMPDLSPRAPFGPSLTFQRSYTSKYAPTYFPSGVSDYSHPMGYRWQHNWMGFLKRVGTRSQVFVHLTSGQEARFTYVSNDGTWDTYTAQAGFHFA